VALTIFVLFQLMYLSFYVGALANLSEIDDLLSPLPHATAVFEALIVMAAILIPVRAFVLCASLFHAPGFRTKFLRLWPFLLLFDVTWALSPFLLLHHINAGLALACATLLVYSPFAQRSLVLMGAGCVDSAASAPGR
jgi:cholera toxin transcriptional activator